MLIAGAPLGRANWRGPETDERLWIAWAVRSGCRRPCCGADKRDDRLLRLGLREFLLRRLRRGCRQRVGGTVLRPFFGLRQRGDVAGNLRMNPGTLVDADVSDGPVVPHIDVGQLAVEAGLGG